MALFDCFKKVNTSPKAIDEEKDLPVSEPKKKLVLDFVYGNGNQSRLLRQAIIRPEYYETVRKKTLSLLDHQSRYENIGQAVKCPWWIVALIHQMESGGRFDRHLHNGDPLTARTVRVPAGRPKTGTPPFTFEESAIDALLGHGIQNVGAWDAENTLEYTERFNGLGYRRRGINTPYNWSMTNLYSKGRYVADGVFDPESVSKQIGVAAYLLMFKELGIWLPEIMEWREVEVSLV